MEVTLQMVIVAAGFPQVQGTEMWSNGWPTGPLAYATLP
jgi:hypothetical protein